MISRLFKHARRFAYSSDGDVYLSPHYDDICFSLGSFLAQRKGGGTLLTLFSRSDHLLEKTDWHRTVFQRMDRSEKIEAASDIRRKEDLAFAEKVGLRVEFADLDEAPVRRRDPFGVEDAGEAARLASQIIEAIAAVTKRPSELRPRLFCPIGIGGHIDHLATLRAIVQHYAPLRARYEIVFYEDLFYASDFNSRIRGLLRFRDIIRPLKARRWTLPVTNSAEKLELIRLYRSQFSDLPESLATFNPASRPKFMPHEAVWTVTP